MGIIVCNKSVDGDAVVSVPSVEKESVAAVSEDAVVESVQPADVAEEPIVVAEEPTDVAEESPVEEKPKKVRKQSVRRGRRRKVYGEEDAI